MAKLPDMWRNPERSLRNINDMWRPFFRDFDEIFDEMLSQRGMGAANAFMPAIDYRDEDDRVMITMDVPGISRDDLNVQLVGNRLTVSGERHGQSEEVRGGRHYSETNYGSFFRTVTLPEGVKPEDLEAHVQNGVLSIAVKKPMTNATSRIKVGEGRPGFFQRLMGKGESGSESEKRQVSGQAEPSAGARPSEGGGAEAGRSSRRGGEGEQSVPITH